MGMAGIWIRTLGDGLIRADQVIGIANHRTPSLSGKPARWLLTVSLAVPAGSGSAESWDLTSLHRTLVQSDREARQAPEELARLLARLAAVGATGVVTPRVCGPDRDEVHFEFTRFDSDVPAEPMPTQADMVAVG
ncbi:hypothetical protein LWP59_22390 [Amycolatopsis acidiphila]|uniref:Uncharacterized protein n=2 Tax=Amycolatopsis acidiphila TaxID=715473 RepID=A0A558A5I4_9PSEU|nr:hypothetical protein [Amycolatopsis acidiphila]TVT19537.1 hypothetical protein FNH06_23955 [Amycolatopsis acidiphila]UIJ63934.1 hypothetical protein LWP59_22390 [Amycolatopsis acidiphila]GHG54387.1 hypothetical protein GCM10017788_04050 [Amycolatopsis acidiphila]